MKKLMGILMFLTLSLLCFSQNLDLIVTTEGDSIACKIDSITTNRIYFDFKYKENWVPTFMMLSKASEYKKNLIKRSFKYFVPGTSYIDSSNTLYRKIVSMRDIPRNSFYCMAFLTPKIYIPGIITLDYERILPITDYVGFTTGIGLGSALSDCFLNGGFGFIIGSSKYFFETGIVGFVPVTTRDELYVIPMAGYRYRSRKGFLFRAGIYYHLMSGNKKIIPGITIGFSR